MAQWNRRQFLSGLLTAVGVEAAAVVDAHPLASPLSASQPSTPDQRPARETPSRSAPAAAHPTSEGERALADVLPEGLHFGRWRIVSVHPVKFGAVPVVLETRGGERFQIDVLARDRRPGARRGVALTRHYSLHLSNVGRGAKPTREEHGLGVLWLAALLRARELHREPAGLLTLRDRLVRFPAGRFDALQTSTRPTQSPPSWGPVRSAPAAPDASPSAHSLPGTSAAQRPALPGSRGEGPTR
jgi:hypothetical protein